MAERRMLTKRITDDDNFLTLSASAQALYLHLLMSADDDGFSNQVSVSMFKGHASTADLEALINKGYVFRFECGVVVIAHWRMHNYIRKDTYSETVYTSLKDQLRLEGNVYVNDTYTDRRRLVDDTLTGRGRVVDGSLTQDRIGKDRLGKDKEIEAQAPIKRFRKPSVDEVRAYCAERGNGIDAQKFVDYYESNGWRVGGKSPMKDWRASVRQWERYEQERQAKPSNKFVAGVIASDYDMSALEAQIVAN